MYIFFIIFGIILSIVGVAGFVASQIKQDTYIINTKLEATSGYPPRLTQLVNEGVVQQTALLSLLPKINFPRLSTYIHTQMTGTISIDCGGEFQETKNFNLITSIPGDKMINRFTFKDLPSDSVCLITAQALTCETEQPACQKNKLNLIVRT